MSLVQNISNISSQLPGNTTLLAEYLSYHFVHGNFQNETSSNESCTSISSSNFTIIRVTYCFHQLQRQQPVGVPHLQLAQPPPCSDVFLAIQTNGWIRRHRPNWIAAFIRTPPLDVLFSTLPNSSCYQAITVKYWHGRRVMKTEMSPFWIKCMFLFLPFYVFFFVGHTVFQRSFLWFFELVHLKADLPSSNVDPSQNITVINSTQWNNLFINQVNGVFIPPGNISTALNATNATITYNLLSSIQFPSSNGTNETGLEFLQNATGITLFVPNNTAFTSEVNQTIASLGNNATALADLIANHVSGSSSSLVVAAFLLFEIVYQRYRALFSADPSIRRK